MPAFKPVKLNRKEKENRKASKREQAVAAEQGGTLVSQMPVSGVCPERGVNWNLSCNPQKWTLRPLSPGHNMLSNLHVSFRHSCKRSPPQERCKVPAFFCSACGG